MTKKKRSDNTKRRKRDMKPIITRPRGIQAAGFLRNETLRERLATAFSTGAERGQGSFFWSPTGPLALPCPGSGSV